MSLANPIIRLIVIDFRCGMFVALALFLVFPPIVPGMFTPAHRFIALETQKLQLFEYGQPFKLHRRSRAELYAAATHR